MELNELLGLPSFRMPHYPSEASCQSSSSGSHAPESGRRSTARNGPAPSARCSQIRVRPPQLLRCLVPQPLAQCRTGTRGTGSGRAGVGRVPPEVSPRDERARPEPRTRPARDPLPSHEFVTGLLLRGRKPLPPLRAARTLGRARRRRGLTSETFHHTRHTGARTIGCPALQAKAF
jgi:hypothetical protein